MSKIIDKDGFIDIENVYFEDIENIDLDDVIIITKDLFNKLDFLMYKYYDSMQYLPLILLFNNLPDITNIPIGTILRLPNMQSLLENISETNNVVNGITSLIPEKQLVKSNENLASPKLNISLKKVSYDENLGLITY